MSLELIEKVQLLSYGQAPVIVGKKGGGQSHYESCDIFLFNSEDSDDWPTKFTFRDKSNQPWCINVDEIAFVECDAKRMEERKSVRWRK